MAWLSDTELLLPINKKTEHNKMEHAQQFVIMTRDEMILLIKEAITLFLNQGITPYPSREDGEITKTFTRDEVAILLKRHKNTITKYIKQRKLHATKINGTYIINEKELIKFINQKQPKC